MNRFFKGLVKALIIFIIILGVFLFIIRDKISLSINIVKRYSDFVQNSNLNKVELSIKSSEEADYKDLIYKNTNDVPLSLDIYKARKNLKNGSPVIVYVHGGSWAYGSKEIPNSILPLLDAFRDEGITIISTSYELMRENENFEKQICDIKDTIRWIYKNKDEYNFDTNKIGIIGASSGAQLALVAAYSDDSEFIDSNELKGYSSNVKYVVDFFGPTDLNTLDLINATYDLDKIINSIPNKEDILNKYSPINYIEKNEPNTLIIHSIKDEMVSYENAEILYNKLKENKNKATLITLEGTSHDFSEFDKNEIIELGFKMIQFITKNI